MPRHIFQKLGFVALAVAGSAAAIHSYTQPGPAEVAIGAAAESFPGTPQEITLTLPSPNRMGSSAPPLPPLTSGSSGTQFAAKTGAAETDTSEKDGPLVQPSDSHQGNQQVDVDSDGKSGRLAPSGTATQVAHEVEPVSISEQPVAASEEEDSYAPESPFPQLTEVDPIEQVSDTSVRWIEETVKSGDSMSRIFSRMGLAASLLHRIVGSSKEAKRLVRIKPGEIVRVKVDEGGEFLELVLERSAIRSLRVLAKEDTFVTNTLERRLEKRVAQASGTITSSLYEGARRAGLSDELIMELAEIFGWDIDFALEIRAGDYFSLIFEERYLEGEIYDSGPILAAEFVNSGKVFRAIRYVDEEGHSDYFSPDGHSMRKAFLRAPVDFRRISSKFTKARWHPVLGRKRPHKGVDYAAATGTPIKAAGDGKVIFRGKKGGYGKTVVISHANKYTTLYAHMSRFKSSVKTGTRVRQGQIIGYVGKSGLATGPHLHYEFRVAGTHRNPLTVKLPDALPIDQRYSKDFKRVSAPLLTQLDLMSKTVLAAAD